MHKTLRRLFHHHTVTTAPDGLTQGQREAIVDLLHFCRVADDKLVVVEEEVEAHIEAELIWESAVPLVTYAAESLARAEETIHRAELRALFIKGVADRLNTTELKARAISISLEMFNADGVFVEQERIIFSEIKQALGWV